MPHVLYAVCRVPCWVLGVGCLVSCGRPTKAWGRYNRRRSFLLLLTPFRSPHSPPRRRVCPQLPPAPRSLPKTLRPAPRTLSLCTYTRVCLCLCIMCVCVCTCMYKHTHSLSISNTQTHMYVCMYVCEYKGTGWVVLWRGVRGAGEDTVEGGRLWTSAHNTCAQRLLTTTAGRCRKRTRSGSCGSSKLPWLRRSVSTWLWQLYLQTQRGSVISRLNARDTHEDEDEGSKDEGSGRRRVCLVVQVGRLLAPGVLQGTDATWPLKAAVGVDHTGEEAGEDADITLLELIEHGTASWPPRQCVLCPA